MPLTTCTIFRSAFDASTDSTAKTSTRRFESAKSYCVQRFSGSVDRETAADFAAALDRVVRDRVHGVVLDLSAVNFFGTVGLVLLQTFVDDAATRSIPVVLVGERTISRPLELTGMADFIRVFETVDEAGRTLTEGEIGPSTTEFAVSE
ncbi:STAS domain-containing protein [Gordonia rubripertincta]|uniref:STAS domain-containing protein n=1 Tax=Gordonia rubripertincta TaxID=36822 RepID=UPI0015FBB9BA|nr:STAS domain-containing protein [Gordonia rubripertincta]QMU21315.1 STAS domain-containing protein [Gordonia rubripertincta]